jgi:hypothetical protein
MYGMRQNQEGFGPGSRRGNSAEEEGNQETSLEQQTQMGIQS